MNASSMTKLAARDFEDLLQVCKHADVRICVKLTCLQCSIPVFELLLPAPQNKILMDVLFELCTWHALAKLRLHTKATARDLKTSTRRLGFVLRDFKKVVCAAYVTKDLPSEEAARGRRKAALAIKQASTSNNRSSDVQAKTSSGKSKTREFNLVTYKFHALGDYAHTITQYGSSDNYTTQLVCTICP